MLTRFFSTSCNKHVLAYVISSFLVCGTVSVFLSSSFFMNYFVYYSQHAGAPVWQWPPGASYSAAVCCYTCCQLFVCHRGSVFSSRCWASCYCQLYSWDACRVLQIQIWRNSFSVMSTVYSIVSLLVFCFFDRFCVCYRSSSVNSGWVSTSTLYRRAENGSCQVTRYYIFEEWFYQSTSLCLSSSKLPFEVLLNLWCTFKLR